MPTLDARRVERSSLRRSYQKRRVLKCVLEKKERENCDLKQFLELESKEEEEEEEEEIFLSDEKNCV